MRARYAATALSAAVAGTTLVAEPALAAQFNNNSDWGDDVTIGPGRVTRGDVVGFLQRLIRVSGADVCGAVTGVYDAATVWGVAYLQQRVGAAVDGIAGPQTWRAVQNWVPAGASAPALQFTGPYGAGYTFMYYAGMAESFQLFWNPLPGGTWKWQNAEGYGLKWRYTQWTAITIPSQRRC